MTKWVIQYIDLVMSNEDGSDLEGKRLGNTNELLKVLDNLDLAPAELEWLRFFYKNAKHSMGPADGDIYRSIAREFKQQGNVLPKEYDDYLFGE